MAALITYQIRILEVMGAAEKKGSGLFDYANSFLSTKQASLNKCELIVQRRFKWGNIKAYVKLLFCCCTLQYFHTKGPTLDTKLPVTTNTTKEAD